MEKTARKSLKKRTQRKNKRFRNTKEGIPLCFFIIRKEYERYIEQKKKSENIYTNPSIIEADSGYYNSRLELMKRLEEEQIKRDREFMSYYSCY